MQNFYQECLQILTDCDVSSKTSATNKLSNLLNEKHPLSFEKTTEIISLINPGRPEKPELVHPTKVPKRKLGTKEGHAGLIHALTHIEFNAINLALDACYRFQDMPETYYHDWIEVAKDEAYHFTLLNNHLLSLGYTYGDFTAHNGLWDMALKTEHDCMIRMALVPRVLEARGIDAVPEMQSKIKNIGDEKANDILDIIHRDEIKHVQYGDKWFKFLCQQRGLNPEKTFFELMANYDAPKIRGAFNRVDRLKAGFSSSELDKLFNQ